MTPDAWGQLLADAVRDAERHAPSVDPIARLARAREQRRDRRGYLAALAFVAFVLLVQADPQAAHGGTGPASVAAPATAPSASAGHG